MTDVLVELVARRLDILLLLDRNVGLDSHLRPVLERRTCSGAD